MRRGAFPLGRPGLAGLVSVLLVLVAVAVGYHRAPAGSFHLDDHRNIVRNHRVHAAALDLASLAEAARGATVASRPLASVSFAIDWWRGGGAPRPFLITNVVIHALAALAVLLLLWTVLARLGGRERCGALVAATVATLAWAAHPIQVQAVAYTVQRMAALACLFTVLALACYLRARLAEAGARRALLAVAALAALALAALSKETAWVAPVLILLAELGLCRSAMAVGGIDLRPAFFALPLLLIILVAVDLGTGLGPVARAVLPGYELREFTLAERLLTQPRVILFHVSQLLWPLPSRFALEHDLTLSTGLLSPATTLPALLVVLAWCVAGMVALTRAGARRAGFFMLWVPATLVIESSLVPLELVFEHRMYLPSVGFAGLLALGLGALWQRRRRWRGAVALAGAAAAALLLAATQMRVQAWHDPLSLSLDAVRNAPSSARAWTNLGNHYVAAGRAADAEEAFRRALSLGSRSALTVGNLAAVLWQQGRADDAERQFRRAVAMGQRHPSVYYNFARLLEHRGQLDAALEMLGLAQRLAPDEPRIADAIARVHRQRQQGR